MNKNDKIYTQLIEYAESLRRSELNRNMAIASLHAAMAAGCDQKKSQLAFAAMERNVELLNGVRKHFTEFDSIESEHSFINLLANTCTSLVEISIKIENSGDQNDAKSFVFTAFDSFLNDFSLPKLEEDGEASNRMLMQHAHIGTSFLDFSEEAASDIATQAKNDKICYHLAKLFIAGYLERRVPLPNAFSSLCVEILKGDQPKFKTGPKKNAKYFRNILVKMVAEIALRKFPIKLDRNPATGHDSLAHILAFALGKRGENITEASVRQIVKRSYESLGVPKDLVAIIEKITLATTQGETKAI